MSIDLPLGFQPEGAQINTGSNLCTKFSVNICIYEDNDQYGKVSLRLNTLDTEFSWTFDDWLVLNPTTASCKIFSPSDLSLIETTTENNIGISLSLFLVLAFALNLTDFQSKDMGGNHSTDHDTLKASKDIPTPITISPVVVNVSLHACCLMIYAVEKFLSGLARKKVKDTDAEMGEKRAIEIS